MSKFVIVLVCLVLIQQSLAALQCYRCDSACEKSKATTTSCGANISQNNDAFCVTQVKKSDAESKVAIRSCKVTEKGKEPKCPEDSVCTSCKSDLCNDSTSSASTLNSVAFVSLILAYVAPKFLF